MINGVFIDKEGNVVTIESNKGINPADMNDASIRKNIEVPCFMSTQDDYDHNHFSDARRKCKKNTRKLREGCISRRDLMLQKAFGTAVIIVLILLYKVGIFYNESTCTTDLTFPLFFGAVFGLYPMFSKHFLFCR